MTLTDFLLARIAEDEAAAKAALGEPTYLHYGDTPAEETLEMALGEGCASEGAAHFRRWMPARVLAECEAKRRIVQRLREAETKADHGNWEAIATALRYAAVILAAIYADHPDYDPTWASNA